VTDLAGIEQESRRYGPIAYVGTTAPDGEPHVAPVAVAWADGALHAFVLASSRKVRNVQANGRASVHFAVSEATDWDSCIVWGHASVIDTTEGRRALWDRMGYDLAAFEPGGPESDDHVFVRIVPTRATILRTYGLKGRETWHA
jgi:nitroimidazol reductase NimA-like FMN-containing flavoprotein (pyridoxamine 5'-phosphate oxidase superfamily)